MHPDLDAKLCERWPLIFAERHGDPATTGMNWGFQCGDGWYGLIDGLCEVLQRDTDMDGEPQAVAMQVKEKFGSLRFRVRGATERQRAMIAVVEAISMRIKEGPIDGCIKDTSQDGGP